jgi:flagellar hook-associated protein 2
MTSATSSTANSLSSLLNSLNSAAGGSSSSSSGSSGTSTGTSSSTGGTISSPGIGSNLNVNAIVTALVNARQAAPQAQITNKTNQINTTLSGLTSLNTSLSALQAALATLKSVNTFNSYTATLTPTNGTNSIGTATTMSSARPGIYTVAVTQLATAQQRASDAYKAGSAVGDGTLSVTVGANTMNIPVSATNSLSDIATAINKSSSNPGVTATIINGVNGQQLMLSSSKTGVTNGFTISANATSSDELQSLATKLNTAGGNEAVDAKLTINGIAVDSPTNTVTGMMDGVTLSLTSTGTNTLTVAQDSTAAKNAIQGFVTAYNSYATAVRSLSSYTPTSSIAGSASGTSGPLLGDSTLASLQRQIGSALSGAVKGNSIGTLANLGITRKISGSDNVGQLSIDSDKLSKALTANPSAVQDLFDGAAGYATKLNSAIDSYTSGAGIITMRITSLNKQLTQLGTQQKSLNSRMAVYQLQLQKQYTSLGTMMSSLNNTSTYLTTALAQLTNSKN